MPSPSDQLTDVVAGRPHIARAHRRSGLNPALLILVALPLFLAAVNPTWLYNGLGTIDPWVYFGYFLHFKSFLAEFFPDTYYGSRLAWILPGYLVHRFFDPVTARYVLHLSFYYLAIFSLYSILRNAVGERSGLVAAVLFGTHAPVLNALGWDNIDGPALAYTLAALACTERAARAQHPRLWLISAGVAAAAMLHTTFFLLIFVPWLLPFYVFLRDGRPTAKTTWTALSFVAWFGLGSLLLTAVLGAVNYSVNGDFFFFMASVRWIVRYASDLRQFRQPGLDWMRDAFWLGFPAMTAAGSFVYLVLGVRQRRFFWGDRRPLLVLLYLGQIGMMVVWDSYQGFSLQWGCYVSFVLPVTFLALGCLLAPAMENCRGWHFWLLVAGTALAFGVAFRHPMFASGLRIVGLWTAVGCITLVLSITTLLRNRLPALLLSLASLWLYQAAFLTPSSQVSYCGGFQFRSSHADYKGSFQRVVDSLRILQPRMEQTPLRFWYNASEEPAGAEFNAINSAYLYEYTQMGRAFPALASTASVNPDTAGVILSSRNNVLDQANTTLKPMGLRARVVAEEPVERNGIAYRLTFFELEDAEAGPKMPLTLTWNSDKPPAELRPADSTQVAPLPSDRWILCEYPNSSAHLERRSAEVQVTTAGHRWAYGSKYGPLLASRSGFYTFKLKYRTLRGGIGFGVLSGNEAQWLARAGPSRKQGQVNSQTVALSLKAGETVVLMITNAPPGGGGSSTYVIESLEAFATLEK